MTSRSARRGWNLGRFDGGLELVQTLHHVKTFRVLSFQLREVLVRSLAQLLYFPIYLPHTSLVARIGYFSAHVITALAPVYEVLHVTRKGLIGPPRRQRYQ